MLPQTMWSGSATANDVAAAHGDLFELIIVGDRLPFAAAGQSVVVVDLEGRPGARLDNRLGHVPGFSLFRRADSLTAHPTTQGVNLRGIGANAAGRVLVTLDGVPLNDPFGGWIYWSALTGEDIQSASIFSGGRAGALSPQALAGSIALSTRRPDEDGAEVSAAIGRFDSYELTGRADFVTDRGYTRISAYGFDSDGPQLLRAEERGPIDVAAASDVMSFSLNGRQDVGHGIEAGYSIRYYEENRTNGFVTARNETEAADLSFSLTKAEADGVGWEFITYYRDRNFENGFTAARDERQTERPVLDQFDVPGWGAGFALRMQYEGFEWGVDGRRLSGATHERFRNLGQGFTRQRDAGGDQWVVGGYVGTSQQQGDVIYSLSTRLDRYKNFSGGRRETNLETDAVLLDQSFEGAGDWVGSGRLGIDWAASDGVVLKGQAFRSWRLPTVNEYYRPFRVGNDITEANANLASEKLSGLELGLDWRVNEHVTLAVAVYRNWLKDGVGNVTIGFGPGVFPVAGFVPPGGVLRQRDNIDAQKIDGVETRFNWQLDQHWRIDGAYLYTRARVTGFDARPELVGLRPVQTPKHSASAGLSYDSSSWQIAGRVRYLGSQLDDDLNARRLDDALTVDLNAEYQLLEHVHLFTRVENLFDATVISAVSSAGLETLARRFNWRVGVSLSF